MSAYETIASSSSLDIVVPDTTLEFFDGNGDGHSWLTKLKSEAIARKLAFFDEQLYFHLVLRLQHPDDDIPADPEHPPPILLSFLARTQVSYDASYISPLSHAPPPTVRLNAPPRSIGSTLKPHGHLPPSIVPPATPNPMPATAENDRRYMRSEGTPLTSGVWGEGSDQDGRSFALLWDSKLEVWTAVFRARIAVAFFQMPYRDPLLCITAHITVRDKPVPSTPARSPLDALVAAAGPPPGSPTDPTGDDAEAETQAFQRFYSGLEEVDLLSGLSGAGGSESTLLTLPSTRLGPDTRQAEYALRATQNAKEQDTPSPARVAPTVRKSFRRTLQTVSGVRLRRRTVLVPHVLVEDNAASSLEERAAGSAERTIVICVEIEHLGETASPFKIDAVRVDVGKETELSARARLVGDQFFPLKLSPFEQHNLLYAVELLGSPFGETDIIGGLQHTPLLPVSIHVDGRPVVTRDGVEIDPTAPFTSSWNTTLDVAPKRNRDSYNTDAQHSNISGMHDVLPEAPSPFPAPRTATSTTFPGSDAAKLHRGLMTTISLTSRRLSAPVSSASPRPASRLQPSRASTGPGLPILREQPGDLGSRSPAYSPTPPSLAVAAYARTPMATTFAPPPTPGFGSSFGAPPPASLSLPPGETDEPFASSPPPVPLTPAYPAYAATSPLPGTPRLATPVGGASPSIGPTVDISRAGSVAQPLSPLPPQTGPISENAVVVSVGLLNDEVRIIRQDKFTLDILVFNRSRWTRRLEISMPPRVRRRFAGKTELVEPGVVPLENRVRVGPLRPSTCQSVRMSFLALKPGVHAVEALVLKDIETDWAMTLRSIIDIVVHEN